MTLNQLTQQGEDMTRRKAQHRKRASRLDRKLGHSLNEAESHTWADAHVRMPTLADGSLDIERMEIQEGSGGDLLAQAGFIRMLMDDEEPQDVKQTGRVFVGLAMMAIERDTPGHPVLALSLEETEELADRLAQVIGELGPDNVAGVIAPPDLSAVVPDGVEAAEAVTHLEEMGIFRVVEPSLFVMLKPSRFPGHLS